MENLSRRKVNSVLAGITISFAILSTVACGALEQVGEVRSQSPETGYAYWLPFTEGKSVFLIQGYNSRLSHKNTIALDFKIKPGTKICAARAGVVEAVKEDSDVRGLKEKYLPLGNHVVIRHADSSLAQYWHLATNGAFVEVGDTIEKGQLIGLSGNTGYSAFPHLHFQVQDKSGCDVSTKFLVGKELKYLKVGRWYRRGR